MDMNALTFDRSREDWAASTGPSPTRGSSPPTSGRCSARERGPSAGWRSRATPPTSPPPTGPRESVARRHRSGQLRSWRQWAILPVPTPETTPGGGRTPSSPRNGVASSISPRRNRRGNGPRCCGSARRRRGPAAAGRPRRAAIDACPSIAKSVVRDCHGCAGRGWRGWCRVSGWQRTAEQVIRKNVVRPVHGPFCSSFR